MPARRKNAQELLLLKPGQLDTIEGMVAQALGTTLQTRRPYASG